MKYHFTYVLLLLASLLLPACGPTLTPAPTVISISTLTPTPTLPPTFTVTSAPTSTLTASPTATLPANISAIQMNCDDKPIEKSGAYRVENNTWGKGDLTGWSQCIGLGTDADGAFIGRWIWNWPSTVKNVKAYPEVIFGQKPGNPSTSADLPKKLSAIRDLTVAYDVTSTHTGSGNLAFDIWLTNTQNPAKWGVPPITHEIMIWLDGYGSQQPGGHWVEKVSIDGASYYVFTADQWGDGWRYIAFVQQNPQPGAGSLNIASFLSYMRAKNYTTGNEYLADIEFGNEVVEGSGETILHKYTVSSH